MAPLGSWPNPMRPVWGRLRKAASQFGSRPWYTLALAVLCIGVVSAMAAWGLGRHPSMAGPADAGPSSALPQAPAGGSFAPLVRSLAPSVPATDPAATPGSTTGPSLGAVVVRRVEQSASLTVQVVNLTRAFNALTALTEGLGGFVRSSNLETGGGGPASAPQASATVVAAVPHNQYAAFIEQAGSLGRVLDSSANGQDVTQQYVDLKGRLRALDAERQSYLLLLGRTTSIGDILQIQSALFDVESQIEDVTGQLQVLNSLSAMATVTVDLLPQPATVPAPPPWRPVAAALGASLRSLAEGFTALALALAWALPWAALALVGFVVLRRTRGRASPRV